MSRPMSRIRAVLQMLGTLVVLGGLLGGVPVALVQWGHWPITGAPSWEDIQDLPNAVVSDDAILAVLTVVLWASWALFACSVVAEAVAQFRGRTRSSVHLGGPLQRVAGHLVGSLVVCVGSLGSSASASLVPAAMAQPALPAAEATAVAVPVGEPLALPASTAGPNGSGDVLVGTWVTSGAPGLGEGGSALGEPGELRPLAGPGGAAGREGTETAPPAPGTEQSRPTVTVQRGDSPWSLAETHLGDGMRWREIWELNRDRTQPGGDSWSAPEAAIRPGWTLALPDDATGAPPGPALAAQQPAPSPSPAPAPAGQVTVEPGDHFWQLATEQLTAAWGRAPTDAEIVPHWQALVDANRHLLRPPGDPDLIYPGQVFTLLTPPPDPTRPAPPPPPPAPAPDPGTDAPAEEPPTGETGDPGTGTDESDTGDPGAGTDTGDPGTEAPTEEPPTGETGDPGTDDGETGTENPPGTDAEPPPDQSEAGATVPGSEPGTDGETPPPDGTGTDDPAAPGTETPTETDAGSEPGTEAPETGTEDPTEPDTEQPEAGTESPTEPDTEQPEAGTESPTEPDTEQPEAGTEDPTEQPEAGTESPTEPDTEQPEAGTEDPTEPDTQQPEAGTEDPTEPDTQQPEAGTEDPAAPGAEPGPDEEARTEDPAGSGSDTTDGTGADGGSDTGSGTEGDQGAAPPPSGSDRTAEPATPDTAEAADRQEAEEGRNPMAIGLIAGGLALAGVVVLLDRRRRAQQRHRGRGRRTAMPDPALAADERALRGGADVDGAEVLDLAMRAAAAGSRATGLPPLRWVEATPDEVVLVLAAPAPPPRGFTELAPDRWLIRGTPDQLAAIAGQAEMPAPTLIPVGTTAEDRELLIELEASGVLTVVGQPDEAVGLLRALAVATATAPWSEQSRVLLVGMGGELTELPWVAPVPRLAEAIEAAETHVDRTTTALWSLRCQSTAQARAAGITPEAWDSLVVVSAVPPADLGERQRVAALADQPRKAVALVAPQPAGQAPVGRTIAIGPDGWLRIDGVDAPVWPHRLEEEDAGIVVALLDLATRREDVAAEDVDEPEVRRAPAPAVPAAAWPDPVAGTAMAGPEEPGREAGPGQPDDLLPPESPAADVPDAPGAEIVGRDGLVPTGPTSGNGDLPAAARIAGDDDPSAADAPAPAADSAAADADDPDDRGPGGGLGLGAAGPDADLASAAGEGPQRPAGEPVGEPVAIPDLLPVPVRRLDALLEEVDVLVRVLGEVEAVRRDRETGEEDRLVPVRQKALEAISYLALRESTVDREDLEVNLFPDGANAAKTVYNTVSAARALVGEELFPPIESGRYSLSERVVTDYGLFCDLVAQADETDDALLAADLLTDALSLVRGEPFTGVGRSYAWVGPHRGMIVAQVVDAAEELAEVRLAMNDWRSAEWAARRGLRAFPSDERMYRLLMRAARAAGNVPGVQRVFRELCDVIADPDLGVEPEDTLHPETVALLEELTGITPRHGQMGA